VEYVNVLVASHGTPGAQAAERMALSLCARSGTLHHLLVVPDLWQGMMGDDWLNNVRTRIAFGNYLEDQLTRELSEHLERLSRQAGERGATYRPEVRQGDPVSCLLDYARGRVLDLLVIGAPRPKGAEGLRSRLKLELLIRGLGLPVLIIPHPDAPASAP
jgi:nucleotide-binding universal stress UspA family protein